MKAIFISNNGCDAILVNNENFAACTVDRSVFERFALPSGQHDWPSWKDMYGASWDGYAKFSLEMASYFGDIVAYYDDNDKLVIPDQALWEERQRYYSQRAIER